jgi:hypothetical protein
LQFQVIGENLLYLVQIQHVAGSTYHIFNPKEVKANTEIVKDERLGYTGDLQAFATTAIFLYNPYGLLKTWLRTLAMEQKEEGNGVPGMFAPNCFRFIAHQPCAIWGDATIIAPWDLYKGSGDSRLLKDQYGSMVDWLDNGITRDSRGLWDPSIYQLVSSRWHLLHFTASLIYY